jgi:hypothetical protein
MEDTMSIQPWQEAVAEVWQLFKETEARFKETEARFKETDARFRETDARFKETDARLDKRIRETDAQIKKTTKEIRQLSALFNTQWGKMVEALVEPNALKLFQERGIQVRYVYRRVKSQFNGRSMELDILLENENEVVVIEVKSALKVNDVSNFLVQLELFLEFFPRYRNYRIYGGVAGLSIAEGADRYAYRQGLFVLSAAGGGVASIKNDPSFRPKDFNVFNRNEELRED